MQSAKTLILYTVTQKNVIQREWFPANTRRLPNAGLMLAQRLRRWPNIKPALGEYIVSVGLEHNAAMYWPNDEVILHRHSTYHGDKQRNNITWSSVAVSMYFL